MYGMENRGNPAGKKLTIDVTGDDGITSIVTQSAEVELPAFSCFGFCVSCENDGSCTRCSAGKSLGPDRSCIERCPKGYTDVIQDDGTSTCQPCSVLSCAVCSSAICSQCLPGSYLYFGICPSCLPNCRACTSQLTCKNCNKGFYLRADEKACVPCHDNCEQCTAFRL